MEDHERLENSGNRGCIRLSYDEFFVFGINRNSAERSPSPTQRKGKQQGKANQHSTLSKILIKAVMKNFRGTDL